MELLESFRTDEQTFRAEWGGGDGSCTGVTGTVCNPYEV